MRRLLGCAMTVAAVTLHAVSASAIPTFNGPAPYLQASDSPFAPLDFSGGYFHLEDFEDAALDTPGVTGAPGGPTSIVFGPSIHDSVDADDGIIDGSGLNGDSWFSSSGSNGVVFTFDASVLGALPTHAGVVWTDGAGPVRFEAFGPGMVSLGFVDADHADGVVNGTTAEDRFYGVIDPAGILAIKLSNARGGIELDHVQYGNRNVDGRVPIPSTLLLLMSGFVLARRTARRGGAR